ncbi:hypothetical protein [Aeromonas media]|uniref:hypothetical protein n=1 Tax=Aeromonas media TaxID=651 RepID=UPI003CFF9A89
MTTNNQATVSYKETTTISADGKVTHQQETKVVGNPTSPEVRELMEKVSDKGSKVGEALLFAAGIAALGGMVTGFNILSKGKKNERVINPDPEKVEELKQRLRKGFGESVLVTIDEKYTQEEKKQAQQDLNKECKLSNEDLMAQLEQLKRQMGDT